MLEKLLKPRLLGLLVLCVAALSVGAYVAMSRGYVSHRGIHLASSIRRSPRVVLHRPVGPRSKQRRHVVAVSIDGLRSDVIELLGPKSLPTFARLRKEGASTLNARTDARYTITLPNHACMLTGRFVLGKGGHGYTRNRMPRETLHQNKGRYVASVFDALHDRGLLTALFASKRKFALFANSYGHQHGAKDRLAPDHGRHKIDRVSIAHYDGLTLRRLLKALGKQPPHFAFVHFRGTDTVGHALGWMSKAYKREVQQQDAQLEQLLAAIEAGPMRGRTTLLVTTDHGGVGHNHRDGCRLENYRIPFFAWGLGVAKGKDLYRLNPKGRVDPKRARIDASARLQPIRNCEVANAVLGLFGLAPLTGSSIGRIPLKLR